MYNTHKMIEVSLFWCRCKEKNSSQISFFHITELYSLLVIVLKIGELVWKTFALLQFFQNWVRKQVFCQDNLEVFSIHIELSEPQLKEWRILWKLIYCTEACSIFVENKPKKYFYIWVPHNNFVLENNGEFFENAAKKGLAFQE